MTAPASCERARWPRGASILTLRFAILCHEVPVSNVKPHAVGACLCGKTDNHKVGMCLKVSPCKHLQDFNLTICVFVPRSRTSAIPTLRFAILCQEVEHRQF